MAFKNLSTQFCILILIYVSIQYNKIEEPKIVNSSNIMDLEISDNG